MSVGWGTPLDRVVGAKSATPVTKALGLGTVGAVLEHYPRTLVTRTEVGSLGQLVPGEQVTFAGRVHEVRTHPYQDRRTHRQAWRVEVDVALSDGHVTMTFFARAHWTATMHRDRLREGATALFSGKVEHNAYRHRFELVQPDYDVGDTTRGAAGLRPIYPVRGALTSWALERVVDHVLDVVDEVPERLPASIRLERGLVSARQAVEWIHRPGDWQQWHAAAKRLRFEEALVAQIVLAQRRRERRALPAVPRPGRRAGLLDRFDERLPFSLTAGQRAVAAELESDLALPSPMHRLLQGEVGSGKTVVALRAMLRVVDSGGQAALLAPTEVLAQQHHRSLTAMLGDLAEGGMLGGDPNGTRVGLLTGSASTAARRVALLDAASGAAGIVVGTHALLEQRVQFADLGLVVVDEQHRFGVEQRAALGAKSDAPPHVLVMTATPIPRTVAMTVFGDLETSTLTELPAGRLPISTSVVPLADHPAWLDRVWARAREEVVKGRQVYVVCPRIGRSDGIADTADTADGPADWLATAEPEEGEARRAPLAVEDVVPELRGGPLSGLRVEGLHGRLAPDRKEDLMRAFGAGEVDVLVATTVVEVGVDVPNATMMVVLDADRFGISQLHQLRGRVGRGAHEGLCLLVTEAADASPARSRLDAVAATLDGFVLSKVDLEQRGQGDLLGASQSGAGRSLRLLSVVRHEETILAAREAATGLVESDPSLSSSHDLAVAVRELAGDERADFLERS